jgi:hypothetical protein
VHGGSIVARLRVGAREGTRERKVGARAGEMKTTIVERCSLRLRIECRIEERWLLSVLDARHDREGSGEEDRGDDRDPVPRPSIAPRIDGHGTSICRADD